MLQSLLLDNKNISKMGRISWQDRAAVFSYPGVTFSFVTNAEKAFITAHCLEGKGRIDVFLDDKLTKQWVITSKLKEYQLLGKLKSRPVCVTIVNRGETWHGVISISKLHLQNGDILTPLPQPQRKLLIIGDSVTCGALMTRATEGIKGPQLSNAAQSYGMVMANMLDAQVHLIGYGGRGLTRSWDGNPTDLQAPDFFEYAVPRNIEPIAWNHQNYTADVILIALGTNDFHLGVPDKDQFIATYVNFIKRLLQLHPQAMIFITEGPMLNDTDPTMPYKTIATSYLKQVVLQFSSANVSYMSSTFYPGDNLDPHPTEQQHQHIADDFATQLKAILDW
ncbi:SGNH/GDSL hydrolase family protein [Aliiglaciecola litoralis]|uniref:Uncharacterized protein n=1 Tax=Aliiglaciecola litoralis TaxID=582857 RepID=A0ABN1LD01_9ALTE